jgi:hypothetical protein
MAGSEIWDQFISHCGSFQESHGSKEQIPLFVPVTRRYRLQSAAHRRNPKGGSPQRSQSSRRRAGGFLSVVSVRSVVDLFFDEAFGDPEITIVFHDADTGI